MEFVTKPRPAKVVYDKAPIYGSIWMALFFALRHEYRLVRAAR